MTAPAAPPPAPGADPTSATDAIIATVWDRGKPEPVTEPQGRRVHLTRAEVIERFRVPAVTTNKRLLPGWAPTSFKSDYRNMENVEASYAVGFDVDGDGTQINDVVAALDGFAGFIYTTHSHTPEHHRLRAIVWTSRPVSADEYVRCWNYVARRLPTVGQAAKDASRLWFMPGIPPGGEYRLVELRGEPLDVDRVLTEAESPPPVAPLPPPVIGDERLVERARRYLATMDPAISGSGGSLVTLRAAQVLVRNFQLPEDTALRLLIEDYNPRCQPPWSVKELEHKIASAMTSREPPPWLAASPGRGPASGGFIDRVTVQRAKLRRRQEDPTRPPIWRVTFELISDDGELLKYRFVVPSDGYNSDAIRTRYRAALPDVECVELRTEWDCDLTSRFSGRVYEIERRDGEVRRVELLATGRAAT